MASISPLLVIVGPTASGKSDLAMFLAKKFNGEIIAADSKTIYKGLDIGTAKPTLEERKKVKHFLIDIAGPDTEYNVADFKKDALEAINDISKRGKLPILVGGSGLYVNSVIYDYNFAPRNTEKSSINPRHLKHNNDSDKSLRSCTLLLGLNPDLKVLKKRISNRVNTMIKNGFAEEVEAQIKIYGEDSRALDAPGYKAFAGFIRGEYSLTVAAEKFIRNDYLLARKQRTWFKRNKSIHWVKNRDEAVELTTTFLNKK